jgi:DNA-binding CsgD family transcriptional regulator
VAAEIEVRRCDFTSAIEQGRTALDLLTVPGWGTAAGLPLGTVILAATRLGQLDLAARYLREPVPSTLFECRYGLHYLYARGWYQMARDNVHAALSDFFQCGDLMRQWSIDVPGLVPWRIGVAHAWLRQGSQEQARRLLNDQLARVGTEFEAVRGAALRLLAACGPQNQQVSQLIGAVEIIEGSGDRYELALALADLSHAHETSGEHHQARLAARRAWYLANSCHAEMICQDLATKLTRTDPPRTAQDDTGLALLSWAERRVAMLASDGHSNRAIAKKLFVTESTVEQHLTKVYRKLKIKNREDLPASLHAEARS